VRDLLTLRRLDVIHELTLSLPWLLAALAAAQWRLYPLAFLASFMFFLTGLRHPIKVFLTYSMFYHVEHHLFPAVPTCRLSILARRLDRAAPDLAAVKVF
jgi:hypothetical protein